MKFCHKCKIEKPKTEFYKSQYTKAGYQSHCKSCVNEWAKANREKTAARRVIYKAENAKLIAAQTRAWRDQNPEKVSAQHINRRARKLQAEGTHTGDDIKHILESQRGLCANCPSKLFKSGAKKYHIDHIQPLSKGGSNWPSNLQLLCPTCNLRKGAKDPYEWAKEQGRLL